MNHVTKLALLGIAAMAPVPAYAQSTGDKHDPLTSATSSLERGTAEQRAGQPEPDRTEIKWDLRLAPVISGQLPAEDAEQGERISLSENTSGRLRLSITHRLNDNVQFTMTNALSITDEFSETAMDASALSSEFRFAALKGIIGGSKPYVSYAPEIAFSDIIEDYLHIDHVFEGGTSVEKKLKLCGAGGTGALCSLDLTLTPAIARLWSDKDDRERLTPKVTVKLAGGISNGLKWEVSTAAEWRIFTKLDLPNGKRREDFHLTIFAGMDVARALFPSATSLIRELKLGARMVRNRTNADTGDYTRIQLLPVLMFGSKL